jgi:hypothetical protein
MDSVCCIFANAAWRSSSLSLIGAVAMARLSRGAASPIDDELVLWLSCIKPGDELRWLAKMADGRATPAAPAAAPAAIPREEVDGMFSLGSSHSGLCRSAGAIV